MDNLEPKKLALIRIWQIFHKYSDYDHPLTQDDIAEHLESDYGIVIERKAISRNISLLKEAGVDMTKVKNGWTWEEFLDVCETVRTHFDNTGRSSQYVLDSYVNWEAVMYPIFCSFGAEIFDDEFSDILYDDVD